MAPPPPLRSSRVPRCPYPLILLCLFFLLVAFPYASRFTRECECTPVPVAPPMHEEQDDVSETWQPVLSEQVEVRTQLYKGEDRHRTMDWPYAKSDLPLAFELSTKGDHIYLKHAFEAQKQLVSKYLGSLWGRNVRSSSITFTYWFRQEFPGHYPLDIVRVRSVVEGTTRNVEILIEKKSPREVVLMSNWNAQQPPIVMIMAYKDEPDSLKRFLERIAEAVNTTKETALRVLIIDFESKVDPATVAAPIPIECRVIQHGSKTFSRAGGLERGVHAVENDNDIIFAVDVDMYLPLDFMKRIRNRVVQGRRAFCPVCQRATWEKIQQGKGGYWYPEGLGMFGAFKSDFVQVGSYNPQKFTHSGGEDVDLAKKFYFHHFMIVRTKEPDYYHVEHCARKRDGWGGYGLKC